MEYDSYRFTALKKGTLMIHSSNIPITTDHSSKKARFKTLFSFYLFFVISIGLQSILSSLVISAYMVQHPTILDQAMIYLDNGDFVNYMAAFFEAYFSIQPNVQAYILLTYGIFIITSIVFIKKINHTSLDTLGISMKIFFPRYLLGLFLGFSLVMIIFTPESILTKAHLTLNDNIEWSALLLFLVGYMIQGFSEEILFRGAILSRYVNTEHMWKGIIISSLVFSLMHAMNPGISVLALINIFLIGIFLALLFVKTKSLIVCGAFHTMWNFTLGNILGTSVSGTINNSSIWLVQIDADELISGGDFGMEASCICSIIILIGILLLMYLIKKDSAVSLENNEKQL